MTKPMAAVLGEIDASTAPLSTAEIAALLDRLAEESGDVATKAAFRRASRALFQQPGGRRPTNDRKLLQEVDNLIAAGVAKSEHNAITKVAGTVAVDCRSLRNIMERLRRKRRKSTHANV
jgi:hypothetical protein